MSFDWHEYITLAEKLVLEQNEANLRSAISRTYYGVFCISRNKKGYKNYTLKQGENIHWKVINEYKNSEKPNETLVGKYLDELRRDRNNADYKEDKNIHKGLAERAIFKAKQVLEMLGEIYVTN